MFWFKKRETAEPQAIIGHWLLVVLMGSPLQAGEKKSGRVRDFESGEKIVHEQKRN